MTGTLRSSKGIQPPNTREPRDAWLGGWGSSHPHGAPAASSVLGALGARGSRLVNLPTEGFLS